MPEQSLEISAPLTTEAPPADAIKVFMTFWLCTSGTKEKANG